MASLDAPSRPGIDDAWAKEAEERIDAYERGEIAAIPVETVFERIRANRRS